MKSKSMETKPSIVFVHGIWADGSCFQKLIPTLRAEGHEVMAAQYGLDTLKGDVDATIRTFGRVLSQPGFALDVIRKAVRTVQNV